MNSAAGLLLRFFTCLLRLYPGEYHQDYAEELQSVFSLMVTEAAEESPSALVRLVSRELRDLPGWLLREHMRARRKRMALNTTRYPDFDRYPSQGEKLGAVGPFLLVAIMLLLNYSHTFLPAWVSWLDWIVLLTIPAIVIIGILRGLSRWTMPYFGFTLYFFLVVASDGMLKGLHLNFATSTAPFWLQAFSQVGEIWLEIFITFSLLLFIAALVPPFRSFFRRIRLDWTQLSFAIYGGILLALTLTDEPTGIQPYMLLPLLALAGGAWLYMRNNRLWGRFLALFGGMTLANLLAFTGLKLGALQGGMGFSTYSQALPRDWLYVLFMWSWQMIALLVPAVLMLLPRHTAVDEDVLERRC